MPASRPVLVSLLLASAALGQPAPRRTNPADSVRTVEVAPDNRVTFRFYAPHATSVSVGGDFTGGGPAPHLTQGEDGVWAYTTPQPVRPDSYTYNFNVDGVGVLDTSAANFKENPNSLFNYFDMPGAETDFMALKDVPHGRVERVLYHSSVLGQQRQLHVYLPPNFEKIKGPLPVLYLLHGFGDNDLSWVSAGKVPLILDNLYAAGKLKNMVVVMPNGTLPPGSVPTASGPGPSFSTGVDDPFSREFLTDIMPLVESTYPVSRKREDTAIAGFSMGGVQTLKLALWHPERFAYVFPISTGFFPAALEEIQEKDGSVMKNVAAHPYRQLVMGCGKQDPVMGSNSKATLKLLESYNIPHRYVELDGAHSFVFSRRFLAMVFPLAFSGQSMQPDARP